MSLKEYRLEELDKLVPEGITYKCVKGSIADKALVDRLFAEYKFDVVVNLAAQAGVRYSIENPDVYIESNIIGFYNILEACRNAKQLVEEHFKTQNSTLDELTLNSQLPGCATPGLCLQLQRLWWQQEGAVCGRRPC